MRELPFPLHLAQHQITQPSLSLSSHVWNTYYAPDEGGPLGHLLDLPGADVGARGPESAEDVEHGVVHVAAVVDLNSLALARPVRDRTISFATQC